MHTLNNLQNKRVTVIGLGLYKEGSGIEAVKFFLRQGAKVTVTDLRSAKELEPSVRELVRYYTKLPRIKGVGRGLVPRRGGGQAIALRFVFGKHREEDFRSADIVFQNPSVPADSPYLRLAEKRNIPIVNDWSIFLSRHTPKLFIGITGTRGKSTTTALIYEMLTKAIVAQAFRPDIKAKALSYTAAKKIYLAGNLGVSPLSFIDTYRGEPIVAELSSWLLHHFPTAKKSPNVAVVTNIMNDHMDKYRNMREYITDKENIFQFQKKGDVLILNRDNSYTRAMARKAKGRVIWFQSSYKLQVTSYTLPGEHNAANVNAAVAAAEVCGVLRDTIVSVLKTFHGLPGRLEFTRTVNGVRYYNDTTATTPEATIAALKTLASNVGPGLVPGRGGAQGPALHRDMRSIVLICGGADKKLDYREMSKQVKKHCKAIVLFKGNASDKILNALKPFNHLTIEPLNSRMKDAVRRASKLAADGDVVLLSPAAASFGLFQNEFDRGKQFVDAVRKL